MEKMSEELNRLLKQRELFFQNLNHNWLIDKSSVSGLGVFSSKNLQTGELVFKDTPIVLGPRSSALPPACVNCMKIDVPLINCSRGCRLPVCGSKCEQSDSHEKECSLLKSLSVKEGEHWSPFLYRALTPFRCLLVNEEEKKTIKLLSSNKNAKHIEMILLKKELKKNFSKDEEAFLNLCCGVLNGTAFETELGEGKIKTSLRGLYPLAGMMNHSCVPNTQRYFIFENNSLTMYIVATSPIPQGTELTTSYTHLLWPTIVRRHFLSLTKEFWCTCERCRDPTEFGTNFSAVECSCGGLILPMYSIDLKSDWKCGSCYKVIPISKLPFANPSAIFNENSSLSNSKPKYISINEKIDQVWNIGHKSKTYKELSDEELNYKEKITRELLDLNDNLNLGDSRMKGLLSLELYETLTEKKNRTRNIMNEGELSSIRDKVQRILQIKID